MKTRAAMSGLAFEKQLRNSRAFRLIRNDFHTELGHAYMIVCADDDVTDEFFTLISASVYCAQEEACFDCAECMKVLHGNHPDVFHLNLQKNKIKVADVKEMLSNVDIKPLSGHKLYFVHRADLMSADAQNKLLKTFEEPPKDVTIFLGVANEAGMLDTIRSRSRNVYMDSFDEETVYEAMLSLGCEQSVAAIAAACSEGQLGKARSIALSPEYAELYKSAVDMLSLLRKSTDILTIDNMNALKDKPSEFLDVLSIILRDMLVAQHDTSLMLSKHLGDDIIKLSKLYTSRALAEIILRVNEARKKLSLNVNPIATVDHLLFSILEVRYKWQQS